EKAECKLWLNDFLEHQEGMLAAVVPTWHPESCDDKKQNDANAQPLRGLTISQSPLERTLHTLRDAMGSRLSLAISALYTDDDVTRLQHLHELSQATNVPLLATNHVHYHHPSRRALQDVLTCVRHQCTIHTAGFKVFPNGERYLKSPQQMHRLFANFPDALRRTMEIAEQCKFELKELRYEYPDEVVPEGQTPIQHLTALTWSGASQRYPDGVPDKVRELIHKELDFIQSMNFEAYFLTVYDVVKFARSKDILCQGRGSAANSAVCYCLEVTSVDPNKIEVLFERFLSAARGEPPDIDIDFEHERREEVIQYIYQKYGRDRAGMTATVITYRGRSAIRDVGKALGLSLDMVDQMARRLDWWHRGVLTDSQLQEVGLNPDDNTIRQTIELTSQLLGFPRHLSQHTGGMVMTRGPLCEMVPIENASMEDRTVIEWDKDDIDAVGILKVDILALGMLTCISKAFAMMENVARATSPCLISQREARAGSPCYKKQYEIHTLPNEDPAVYEMICNADTIGVFQIESRAQMSMLPRLRPEKFYDLVIEVAIVRPGPIQGNMVHPYLQRREMIREGKEADIKYESEALRQTLAHTLGVPLFQEQAMRVVMVAAGFTAAEADQLRRAMAAWRRNGVINTFYPKIINGMLANGYSREFAERVFEQIQGFGEYGFPESHAASFAILVYASAWIKRHHPAAFCAALLNSQPMGFYAPAQIVRDAREHGVTVLPPDVNESRWDCILRLEGEAPAELRDSARQEPRPPDAKPETWGLNGPAVRLGFRVIKGFREEYTKRIVECRNQFGAFTSIEQFQRATGLPVKAIQRLAEADAFSSIPRSRRESVWESLVLKDEQMPLFDERHIAAEEPVTLPKMPLGQEVMTDYSTIGLSLKKHPVALIREELKANNIITSAELMQREHGKWAKVAGLVLIRQRPGTASGIVFVTLEDETGIVNLIVRPDIYEKYRLAARHAGLLQAEGYVERKDKVIHIMVKRMFDLSDLLAGYQLRSRDFH
ncbi:MAG TPA: error-prone DNA polymerase, partial [Tepidisphaeraceae bacterium]|nr:error-prone DNA polymerase [Tepidisphaeraceae bacterium]